MGKPLKLSTEQLELVNAYLQPHDDLPNELPAGIMCYLYTVANICGDQLATSGLTRGASPVSLYVLVRRLSTGRSAAAALVAVLHLSNAPLCGSVLKKCETPAAVLQRGQYSVLMCCGPL